MSTQKKKLTILREYFRRYIITRCQLPQRESFRLIIVDGFSGAGLYKCGTYGSPLVFVDTLGSTLNEINISRIDKGIRPIQIECLLILNDLDKSAVELLRKNIAPLLAGTKEKHPKLKIIVEFKNGKLDVVYTQIKERMMSARCRNVLFNLDQYGHSTVNADFIKDIMQSWKSAEVFLTFSIDAFLAYISPNPKKNSVPLNPEIHKKIYESRGNTNKEMWLGEVERIVFENLKDRAPFVSPFAINNPDGWGYWLMHFANSYRARQVYNDILHENSQAQAHFGRSGLNMLSYDPKNEGQLYLFDDNSSVASLK